MGQKPSVWGRTRSGQKASSNRKEALHSDREGLEIGNASRMTLPKLSTELILDIADYLPSSGYMSLSYSCRTIRHKMGASIAHVLGDKAPTGRSSGSTLSAKTRNIRIFEQLELRRMLDRDGMIGYSRAFCIGCRERHHCSLFTTTALAQLDTERRCLGSDGLVWFCPHRAYGDDKVTRSFKIQDGHNCGSSSSVGLYYGYYIDWSIMMMPRDHVPTSEEIKEALRPLHAPICPHLRLSDACVVQNYNPDCRRLQWKLLYGGAPPECRCFICLSEPVRAICNFCDARVVFNIKSEPDGPRTLILTIRRNLGSSRGYTDRAWIAQVAQPADFEEYERAWQTTDAECCRRMGSVNLY